MFKPLKMEKINMRRENLAGCSLADALAWAAARFSDGPSWLLAESPAGVIWGSFKEKSGLPEIRNCLSLTVFDSGAEMRFNRSYGADHGVCRRLWTAAEGEESTARLSSYLLKGVPGRLLFAEHFMAGENGLYSMAFNRFYGVEGQKA